MCAASSASFPPIQSPADLASEARLGLVQVSTSDTVTVDPREARIRRLRRNVLVAAKCLVLQNQGDKATNPRPAFGTLTYRPGVEWERGQVASFLKRVREWLRRQGHSARFRYVWVAELQGRGAVHFHFVLWLPRGLSLPMPDKRGWWPHGSTNVQWAHKPIGYLTKYLSKGAVPGYDFPKGCRLYGIGGLDRAYKRCRRWINLPSMIQGVASIDCQWARQPGGGWVNRQTGEHMPSEWGLRSATRSATSLVRLWQPPKLIDAIGPFSWIPEQ